MQPRSSGTSIFGGMNAQSALTSTMKADGHTQSMKNLNAPIVWEGWGSRKVLRASFLMGESVSAGRGVLRSGVQDAQS